MGQKLLVGNPIAKGVRTDRTAFGIDNDSFPVLENAYQWRGRIKRKRGTAFLCRLTSFFASNINSFYSPPNTVVLNGSGQANIVISYGFVETTYAITGATQANPCVLTCTAPFVQGDEIYISGVGGMMQLNGNVYVVQINQNVLITLNVDSTGFTPYTSGGTAALNIPNITLQPGSVTIISATSGMTYTDDGNGNMLNSSKVPVGTINYATGILVIMSEAGSTINSQYNYYTGLPVMGLEDFITPNSEFPGTIAFDTVAAYNIPTAAVPSYSYDVSYYKNVPSNTYTDGMSPNTAKTRLTPTYWHGTDYQQFWTVNYLGAMFATNGITIPFDFATVGMSFTVPSSTTYNGLTQVTFVVPVTSGIIANDFVFVNEYTSTTPANAKLFNMLTGYVYSQSDAGSNRTIVVIFPFAAIPDDVYTGGILQVLTKQVNNPPSNPTKDCIRWYDGDPTVNGYPPVTNPAGMGWLNYQPPLSIGLYSIADQPAAQYYLVGARIIFPFKDRLLFIGPVIQTSTGNPIYLQDTVIYSQNGTPYYTCNFQADPILATTQFTPLIVPNGYNPATNTATPLALISDQPGFGGWAQVGIDEKINTASLNENVIILGMDTHQVRMVYTSNDLNPFNFYIINSELGSSSTFSSINMDKGVLSRGQRGFVVSSQVETQRFDLDVPDQVFQINSLNQGVERVCANRDFINEWVQFTYPDNTDSVVFPNFTLQYNYRDKTWATFYECYTTYGNFRISEEVTWATLDYNSWAEWNDPWNAGASNEDQPLVIAGNQQGFVIVKGEGEGTSEDPSLYITNIVNDVVYSPYHSMNSGDFITITGCIGTISSYVNSFTFQIAVIDNDSFMISPLFNTGTYLGGGLITRQYVPFFQTKQFPVAWEMGRKTRLGPSMYLLDTTDAAQMTLLIYLSQNSSFAYNTNPPNNALVYSTVLYTCPESTNLGLTPANTNLQMVTAGQQEQTWHRINESLLGDTVQLGFTVSDAQMMQIDPLPNTTYIVSGATNENPCVLTCRGMYAPGQLLAINLVNGMTELNYDPAINNFYSVISADGTYVTINIDSTGFGEFTLSPDAIATQYGYTNIATEIELHCFIMDVNPSMVLA